MNTTFLRITFLLIGTFSLALFLYAFFVAKVPESKNITWGVNFSQMQAESLKLDWKKTYLAILEDLGVKNVKLLTQWDWVEGKRGEYYFKDIDWQIQQTQKNNANLIYVLGMKTGRWPECHAPSWSNDLSKKEQQSELLAYIEKVVLRYKNSKSIIAWQVENEPLFNFGVCPWYDKDFLVKEVALVKSLDPTRPVIITDSGEQSLWLGAGKIGDVVGVTMYRKLWFGFSNGVGFYGTFPIPPNWYYFKAQFVKYLYNKKVIGVELQAEPWAYKAFPDLDLQEQAKTMNINQFQENVSYAKKTGFDTNYFWGVEWWYWLKTTQNKSEIWDEAKKLF